jgi:Domain of unknown function (DUF4124)
MCVSLSVSAAFYKWVDKNGITQYSQTPPATGSYQELHSSPPAAQSNSEQPSQDASSANKESDSNQTKTAPQAQHEQDIAKQQAAREQNCQLARQRVSILERDGRIRTKAADGSVRVMSEEEKQAKLDESRKMVEEMCQ